MRIDEIYASAREPVVSFEFFPPRTPEGEANLAAALEELARLEPDFVSVTWGAGGSTRTLTLSVVADIRERFGLEAMPHLTLVGSSVAELRDALTQITELGIENVLALRGDPPAGADRFEVADGGLRHASELTRLVSENYDFCIVGACYPEGHQEAPDADVDLQRLRDKVDAGARVLITQLFFDNADYFRFVERARGVGIEVPIVPGIFPITSLQRLERITSLCGATIPPELHRELRARADDPEATVELGLAFGTAQCADLLAGGAPGLHFYTLNRAAPTGAMLTALRLTRPWERIGQSAPSAAR